LRDGPAERHSAVQRIPRSHSSASLRSRSALALSCAARASLRYRIARALLIASQIPTQQNEDSSTGKKDLVPGRPLARCAIEGMTGTLLARNSRTHQRRSWSRGGGHGAELRSRADLAGQRKPAFNRVGRNRVGPRLMVIVGPPMLVEPACMGIAYVDKPITALAAGALLLSLSLGGCATSTAGSSLMDAQAEAPAPPKPSAYPPLEDLPPKRDMPAMTTDERLKLTKELIAARERQAAAAAKARGDTAQAEPMKL
jgi:hypothetical protein